MGEDPFDITRPKGDEEDVEEDEVIDLIPKPPVEPGRIDFDSHKPLIEQVLETHELDREDKRPDSDVSAFIIKAVVILLLLIGALMTYLIVKDWVW